MGIDHKKVGIPVSFLVIMMLLYTNCCRGAILLKSNTTYRCNGDQDECLISDDWELEFLMDSHFSRMLAGGGHSSGTGNTSNPTIPAIPCGPGQPNSQCLPNQQKNENCGGYKRNCQ